MQKLVFLNPKNSSPPNQSMLIRNIFTSLTRTNPQISPIINHLSRNHSTPLQNPFKFSRQNQIFCSSFPHMASDCKTIHSKRPQGVPLPPITADKAELFRGLEAALGSPLSSEPLSPAPKPLILVISGPSGVGKDAVIKRLREVREGIHFVVTATSRGKRPGEIDGKDYYFVTKEQFLLMVERNELLEYALVYGDYKGIPKQQIRDFLSKGHDIVLRVDIQGAATLKSILGNSAVFIFLVAESENALVKRLVERKTETTENLLLRIATAREEVKHIKNFDYVVVNAEGMLENAVKLVESIMDAEKAKVKQRTVNI